MKRIILQDAASDRENGFNLLRMLAATAVLFSHCFVLATGRDEDQPFYVALGGMTVGNIAVDIFFFVSGFLVCSSLMARQNVRSFWRARFFRVFPGLAASVLITVAVSAVSLRPEQYQQFFGDKHLWLFVVKNLTLFFGVWTSIPVALDQVPYHSVANGSLWTLPFEVRLYLGLGLLWLAARSLRAAGRFPTFEHWVTLTAFVMMLVYLVHADPSLWNLRFSTFFCCGVAAYVHRSHIHLRVDLFLVCAVALAISAYNRTAFYIVYDLVLGYLILFVVFARLPVFRFYNRLGDYSYGMYIYAFPVQQFIAKLIPGITAWQMLPLSFGITLIFAVGSWHLIEMPALRRKPRVHDAPSGGTPGPGRPGGGGAGAASVPG